MTINTVESALTIDHYESAPTTISNGPTGVENIVVIRESDMYDMLLMAGLIETTLRRASGVPGAAKMLEVGVDVLANPEKYDAHVIRSRKSRTIIVECEGTIFIYSMGSATLVDSELGANRFATELVGFIERFRPKHVWTAEVARLLRAYRYTGVLYDVFAKYTEVLHADVDIDFRLEIAQMLWSNLATIASMERNTIVRRLAVGQIHQYRRGEWLIQAVPPGYRRNKAGKLVIDEDQVDLVRRCLPIVVDDALSSVQKCERLGELGLSRTTIRQRHGEDAGFADVRNSTSAINSLLGWMDLWETGRHQMRYKNSLSNLSSLLGMTVHPPRNDKEAEECPDGYFLFDLETDLPEGGWASPEVFNKARQLAADSRRDGSGGHRHLLTKPFAGLFEWTDSHENKVLSKKDNYEWFRRDIDPSRQLTGWHGHGNARMGERVAVIRSNDLHSSIADGVAAAIRSGAPAQLLESPFSAVFGESADKLTGTPQARRRAIKHQLEQVEDGLRRARRNANGTDDEDLLQGFLEDAESYSRKARRLKRELDELNDVPEAALGASIQTMGGVVAKSLGELSTTQSSTHRDVRSALETIIRDAHLSERDGSVEWSVYVHVPADGGVLRLGPISGTVENQLSETQSGPPRASFPKAIGRRARSVLGAHPDQGLIADLLAHMKDPSATHSELIPLLDHLAGVYTDSEFKWKAGIWRFDSQPRQEIIDALLAAGGSMTIAELKEAEISKDLYNRYSKVETNSAMPPVLARHGRWAMGPATPDRAVGVKECPHCGGFASSVTLVPEVTSGVLCPQCRKMPTTDSPVFPTVYLEKSVRTGPEKSV